MSDKSVKSTGRESDQFNLRFPDGMRERLKDEAAKNNRSMNAEIIARLEETLDPDSPSLERLKFFEDQYEQAAEERKTLYDALNNQERLVQKMHIMHRNFAIIAKGLGRIFLEDDPDKVLTRKALATMLMELEEDDSSDPSEPVPAQPWEK